MIFSLESRIYLTVTAIILLILKKAFKRYLSAKWQFLLWSLLAIRFLFPDLPESSFSLFSLFPDEVYYESAGTYIVADPQNENSGNAVSNSEHKPKTTQNSVPMTEKASKARSFPFKTIEAVGGIILFICFSAVYISHERRLKNSEAVSDRETTAILCECKNTVGIKRKVTVISGSSPALFGFIKPKIILPDGYSPEEKRNVFLHELCHLKNFDIPFIWAGIIFLCLNWYNPLMWYCFSVFKKDIELYCDERVLALNVNKKDYAQLLVKTALMQNRFVPGTTFFGNGEKQIERRIKHMANFKKPKIICTALILLTALAAAVLCLTNSKKDYSMSDEKYSAYSETIVGSFMAELDYADGETAVFHYLDGLFVYDRNEKTVTQAFDLTKLNCAPHTQGSCGITVTVSGDGKKALIVNYGPTDEIKDFDNYILDLTDGTARKTTKTSLDDAFSSFRQTHETLEKTDGWISDLCITESDGSIIWLTAKSYLIGGLILCEMNGAEISEEYVFGNKAALYDITEKYLSDEFVRVYSPYYIILDLAITDFKQNESEAEFFYTMTHRNFDKDPDTVDYIIRARESGSEHYEQLKKEYLEPKITNYHFKISLSESGEITLYSNVGTPGDQWVKTSVDDYIASQ